MPVYKDEESGTWYCSFHYKDWQGKNCRKLKRGFKRKKDASDFESTFKKISAGDLSMPFDAFCDLYLDDMKNRLKESTFTNKQYMFNQKVKGRFGNKAMNEITIQDIRTWQNELMASSDYSATYLKTVNNQLSALFNYAVKYYHLRENPCRIAGHIGKSKADEMQFWTLDEYRQFRDAIPKDDIQFFTIFEILYYTGIREGELLALTPSDIDFSKKIISITKSYAKINGKAIISSPKTPRSIRDIPIPQFLCDEIKAFKGTLYGIKDKEQMFTIEKNSLIRKMKKICISAGVKPIRVHDLRHSHASLLIEKGFSPLLVRDRLGHEDVETTLNTYSHLWPNKQDEIVSMLNDLR